MRRRIAIGIALALCLVGCGSVVLPWDRVELSTSSTDARDCILLGAVGELIVDPNFGTALKRGPDDISPVVWPAGFTGRRLGPEVEVLDRDRNAIATTGNTYEVFYRDAGFGSERGEVLVACGEVQPHAFGPPQGIGP